jgi:hypothetical protein
MGLLTRDQIETWKPSCIFKCNVCLIGIVMNSIDSLIQSKQNEGYGTKN